MAIQILPTNPFNPDRLYKLFILLCLVVLVIIVSDMFKSCRQSEHDADISPIKHRIIAEIKRKDSVQIRVLNTETVRDRWLTKWKTKHDTITVQQVITLTDSIIKVDSTLISELKEVIKIDSSIIRNYQIVATTDSNTIVRLNKSLKKQRNKTKLAVFVAAIFGGVAVLK